MATRMESCGRCRPTGITPVPAVADFDGPAEPGGADQPRQRGPLPLGHVAVVKGQVTAAKVTADKQAVTVIDHNPRPRVPPLALRSPSRGADLPVPRPQHLLHRILAGQDAFITESKVKILPDPQHVRLPYRLQVLAQLRAGPVHFITANKIEKYAFSIGFLENLNSQLALGEERQAQRESHPQERPHVLHLLLRDPLAEADQRVPDLLPDIGKRSEERRVGKEGRSRWS